MQPVSGATHFLGKEDCFTPLDHLHIRSGMPLKSAHEIVTLLYECL